MSKKIETEFNYSYSEQMGAILGHIYREDNHRVSLAKVNRYLKAIDLTPIKKDELSNLVRYLDTHMNDKYETKSSEDNPSIKIFKKVTEGSLTLEDVLGSHFDSDEFDSYMSHRVSTTVMNTYEEQAKQREFKKLLKEGAYMQSLIKGLTGSLIEVVAKTPIHTEYLVEAPEEAPVGSYVMLGSDWHIGACIKMMNNEFNFHIFKYRWNNFLKHSIKDAKSKGYKSIHFYHLGDIIEGIAMRPTQGFSTEFTQAEQITRAFEVLLETLEVLATNFDQVYFTGVSGNHDRLQGDKKSAIETDSAMYIILQLLDTLSKTGRLAANVAILMPKSAEDVYTRTIKIASYTKNVEYFKNVCLTHGERVKVNGDHNLINFADENGVPDLLLYGHYHNYRVTQEGENKMVMMCGSIQGYNDYSDKLNKPHTGAEQTAFEVLPDDNIILMPYYFKGGAN